MALRLQGVALVLRLQMSQDQLAEELVGEGMKYDEQLLYPGSIDTFGRVVDLSASQRRRIQAKEHATRSLTLLQLI